ncbi:hypothetical protein MHYP_G00263590 [Metynnis hypsauchen]
MKSCSSALCVLILLTTAGKGFVSAPGPVKVKLHDSATLSCSGRCSGLARWTVFHKRSDTLAECDRTSCRSVKEGYQMIHDEYLKGNHSLIITDADLTKRGWYTSDCDGKDVCDVQLRIKRLHSPCPSLRAWPQGKTHEGPPGLCQPPMWQIYGRTLGLLPLGEAFWMADMEVLGRTSDERLDAIGGLVAAVLSFTRGSVGARDLSSASSRSESADSPVKVNLHDSATLPCSERCSGLVRWTVFHKPTDALAECDQTSCRSVKEGYEMIHDQYLKGNLSLTIADADFSKRGWYTSDCDGKDLCDVNLLIEPLNTTVQIEPGESLLLELDISDPVEVVYNSTNATGPSCGQICTMNGHSAQCKEEYKERVSAALELRGVTPSDSGVYTVMDERTDEVIHIYTVTVGSAGDPPDLHKGAAVPVWSFTLIAVLLVMCAISVVVIVQLKREIQQLRMKIEVQKQRDCHPQ